MIIIKNGENIIFDPRNPNLKLINPVLKLEDSAAGSLSFRVYNDNLNYNTIKKLFPVISVVRDGKTIFKGRAISDKKDFYNGKTVEVEGKLAFLNDSCLEPFNFTGTPADLFAMIIENHNSQVSEWQRLKVGVVTVRDNNDYIVRSSEKCMNTWNALKEKCFKSSLGGHIRIRYEESGDFIDWLSEYEAVSSQSIEFSKNLIDIVSEVDATETYTAIRPIGAEVNGKKIDISSVNNGKTYIVNEEKVSEYGIIFAPENESTWDDVTVPENLLKKAKEKLNGSFVTLKETYEIKAVDLSLTEKTIEAMNVCEFINVDSKPHGINANYFLNKIEMHIASPQNSVFYLGSSKRVLTDMNTGTAQPVEIPQNISTFKNDANYISLEKTEEMLSVYTQMEQVEEMLSGYPQTKMVVEIVNEAVANAQKGENGKDGVDGKDGATPVIGDNGNWFIDGVDTGKPSRGEAGSPGADGSPGARGDDGNAATIRIGTVETVENEAQAEVVNTGSESNAVFNFKIPKGKAGEGAAECLKALGGFSFGYTDTGKPGYKENGTDVFVPFSDGGSISGTGGVRMLNYLLFDGEGLKCFPTATILAESASGISFNRITKTIRYEGTIS